ncbi:MAG: LTA synthase family protein [Fimbriimonadaceae bacterium]|nr:LTA synthase family protein [Fimbriimonadaceae bacterium]
METPKLRSVVPIHPPLIAVYPVLAIYSANMSLWSSSELWMPLLVSLISSLGLWSLAALFGRSWLRGALVATGITVCIFLFRDVTETVGLWGWIGASLLTVFLCARTWKGMGLITRFLNATAVILVVLSLASILQTGLRIRERIARSAKPAIPSTARVTAKSLPDVFYIILDGYGRSDELQRVFGIDNRPFLKQLESLGFIVCTDSYANYVQTEISLASSLNLDYVENLFKSSGTPAVDRASLDRMIDASVVARQFSERGYVFVAVTTGFPALEFQTADITLPAQKHSMLLGATLMQLTPLRESGKLVQSQFDERRKLLKSGIQTLGALSKRGSRPRFVVAHILAPHPPFVFGPNGEERRPNTQYSYADGSHFFANGGTEDAYRSGYRDQLEWLNSSLIPQLEALCKLQPPPILILQGDHGSKLMLDQESATQTDVREAFANLMALKVPEDLRQEVPMNLTPVNIFRILMNAIFDTNSAILPNRSYFSAWSQPMQFTDVTKRLDEQETVQQLPLQR